jgi:LPS-assembly lipoprotein
MLVSFSLSACGFRPLYAQKSHNNQGYGWQWQKSEKSSFVINELAKIVINPIKDREGQILREELREQITPKGIPENPKYYLNITVDSPSMQQGIRSDDTATRETVFYKAYYSLKQGRKTIVSGQSRTEVGYNLLENPYASVASIRNAGKRAAKVLANDIALRLSVFFDFIEKEKMDEM